MENYKTNRAKKKIEKHHKKIDDILRDYPGLSDTFYVQEIDTIFIESDSGKSDFKLPVDSAGSDKIIDEIIMLENKIEAIKSTSVRLSSIDSSRTVPVRNVETDYRLSSLRDRVKTLKGRLSTSMRDTSFTFSDSTLDAKFVIKKGVISFSYKTKEKKLPYEKTIKNVRLDTKKVKKSFLSKYWPYLLILILIIIIFLSLRRN